MAGEIRTMTTVNNTFHSNKKSIKAGENAAPPSNNQTPENEQDTVEPMPPEIQGLKEMARARAERLASFDNG